MGQSASVLGQQSDSPVLPWDSSGRVPPCPGTVVGHQTESHATPTRLRASCLACDVIGCRAHTQGRHVSVLANTVIFVPITDDCWYSATASLIFHLHTRWHGEGWGGETAGGGDGGAGRRSDVEMTKLVVPGQRKDKR